MLELVGNAYAVIPLPGAGDLRLILCDWGNGPFTFQQFQHENDGDGLILMDIPSDSLDYYMICEPIHEPSPEDIKAAFLGIFIPAGAATQDIIDDFQDFTGSTIEIRTSDVEEILLLLALEHSRDLTIDDMGSHGLIAECDHEPFLFSCN